MSGFSVEESERERVSGIIKALVAAEAKAASEREALRRELSLSEARARGLADRLRQVRLMTPNEATGCWCVVSTPGEGHSDRCKALTDLFFSWEAFARSALKEAGERPSGRRA